MATIEQRIKALEQQTPSEVFSAYQLANCTDEELLDIFLTSRVDGCGSHEAWILESEQEIINGGENHGND